MERESLLTDVSERKYLQDKIKTLSQALDDLNKTNTPIIPLLKGLETGNAPGEGKIKEVVPERTEQSRPRNPMQDIMGQMLQPENLQNMMGMVEQMMNPRGQQEGSNQSTGQSRPGLGGLGGLMSSMMGNMPGGMGGLMGAMMGGNRGQGDLSNVSRTVSNASVETNIPLGMNRTMSNGGLIDVSKFKLFIYSAFEY